MNTFSRKRPISRISTTTGPITLPLDLSPTRSTQRRPPPPPPSHKHRRTRLTRIPPLPKSPVDFEEGDDPFSDDKCLAFDPITSSRNPFLSPMFVSGRMQQLQNAPSSESRCRLVAGMILNRVGGRSMRHSIERKISLNQNGHFYVKSGLSNVLLIHESDSEDSD